MRKIKIFVVGAAFDLPKLEDSINEFIKDKHVSNIQYQMSTDGSFTKHGVMVVYEEEDQHVEIN